MNNEKKQPRILSVDDDPMVRDLIRAILAPAAFEVITTSNGQEAFGFIETESTKEMLDLTCIILDVEMPGMSGLDVLSKLKLEDHTKAIPVILLTCKSTDEDIEEGYARGADYYIAKPFTREQLLHGISLVTSESGEV